MDHKPFVSGMVAGVAAGFIGHPLDTIRIRMQMENATRVSARETLESLVKHEGVYALFKGVGPALLGFCSTSGIRFGVFGNAREKNGSPTSTSLEQGVAAAWGGAKAGVVLSPVVNIIELLKCRQQVSRAVRQLSLGEVFKELVRREGLRGLSCGYLVCLPRNVIGNAALFGAFDFLNTPGGGSTSSFGTVVKTIGSGIAAGALSWTVVYPIDVIKTNIVSVADPSLRPSAREAATRLWHERALFRGLGPTLMRSVPVNFVYLPTYVFVFDALT